MARTADPTEYGSQMEPLEVRSDSESALAKIWADVLRRPHMRTDENFFDIGGDSLKAMEVILRVSEVLQVELPLISFFEDPTVAHLAAVVDELKGSSASTPILRLRGRREFPLSYSQQMFWLLEQQNPGTGIYNTARVFRLRGTVDSTLLERSLNELRQRHEILRVRFVQGTGGVDQVVDATPPLPLLVTDLGALEGDAREQAARKAALETVSEPFNLDSGPVLRARLVRLTAEECLLCIAMHHVVSDGFTGGILLEELGEIYDAFAEGRPNPLPEPELHFTDYAAWEQEWMIGPRLEEELKYWSSALDGAASRLDLPADFDRVSPSDLSGHQQVAKIPDRLFQQLQELAQANGTTLFTVLAAALRILLYRWTGQADFLLGTIASNRSRGGTERIPGCFVNPLPLRNPVADHHSIIDLLDSEKRAVMDAFAHQDCPFAKIVEAINPERTSDDNPLFNVALLLQNFPVMALNGRFFQAEHVNLEVPVALLDLRFIATETSRGLECHCEYRSALFDDHTIQGLLEGYLGVLTQAVSAPQTRVEHIPISEDLLSRGEEYRQGKKKQTIAIAANFTAEPVEQPLAFWMEQLRIPSRIEFAPYDNVFQQLLDPSSALARNRDGFNVVFVRWPDGNAAGEYARELAAALRTAAMREAVPLLVCVCPPAVAAAQAVLSAELKRQAGVHVIMPADILDLYPVENYRDIYADAVGAIPYIETFFIAMASIVARRIHSIRSAPYKVIVLDCDNTLWKGVCGEDGPLGVDVDTPRRELQEFMLAQREAGMVLCLCSKNAEADVAAVFGTNPKMALRNEHIVASRINWRAKSENLKELARELRLGLDSFIVVDDNPLECAEIRANCPAALVLELPAEPEKISGVLRHFWAFDHINVTREDRKRSELYRQEREREDLRGGAADLEEFLDRLELKIDIRPMQPDDLARVAQLTQRTNQFNCTTIRRTERDIERACENGTECLVVEVRDRFGDYGLVGVTMFAPEPGALAVETLLMSCRALGRRVEHHVLAWLGDLALERGLPRVDVKFIPTSKNEPALAFLQTEGAEFRLKTDGQSVYCFPASYASEVRKSKVGAIEQRPASTVPRQVSFTDRCVDLSRIATELGAVEQIATAIRSRPPKTAVGTGFAKARNATEETLAGIWAVLLRVSELGVHDNFFLAGGNSLLGVQVIARIRQTLGVELPLRAIFEAPTIAGLAEVIELERRTRTGLLLPPLVKRSRVESVPASFAQQRLWFIAQLEPENSIYNIVEMNVIHGDLNLAALQKSVQEIVTRHDTLRTTFASADGQPLQVIAPDSGVDLLITDLSHVADAEERERERRRLAREEAVRPFDLAKGPLFRARLLQFTAEEHALILTLHHIVCDRWSLGVLSEELAAFYAAFTQNQPPPLPDLPVQYADFSEWQRGWLHGEDLARQAAYWQRQLAGAPALIEIPADRPRSAAPSHRGAIESHLLPAALVAKLDALSQAEGVTLFMSLLAAFQTLLFRYSGQEDIVVGSPVAGRNYAEIEPLIGFFVNTLALRVDLTGDPTFLELLGRVKEVTLDAYAHQDIPFEKLVEELQTERSLSYNPIFQIVFALQNAPMQPLAFSGLNVERTPVHAGSALFDLSWFVVPVAEGLLIRAEYSTDLFNASTIRRLLNHFQELISGAVANSASRLSELPLITAGEQHQLLVEWNDTALPYSDTTCAHFLFERQTAATPENTAVVFDNQRTTYRELNHWANQIAHYLQRQGLRPQECVGLALPRSADMIAGLLAVLKAGGAYLPLDIEQPKERLAYILDDAQVRIILTEKRWLDQLPPHANALCLDRDLAEIEIQPGENPSGQIHSGDLAYVIYTSGSTGRPKGVEIEHRGLMNLIAWHQSEYQVQADDRATQVASPAFDASVWEIWPYLTAGAALHIPNEETRRSPVELVDWLTREGITLTFLPTPLAEAVLDYLKTRGSRGLKLRALLTGGDKLHAGADPDLPFVLVNHYGPTENTVVTTWARVSCGPDSVPPIGKPIRNTRVYVLDRNMKPVPIGVPGELYIAGDGLARGYKNRPDLTAARFLPDPFSARAGARVFRSGDRVRYLASGELEFLGRLDDQIKLRGYRIEPGEIESILGQHPAVKECAVLAREDPFGNKQLVAYIMSRGGDPLPVAGFRELLRRHLPEYMVPPVFISVDAFPLTPNGKVDHKALPAPEFSAWKSDCVAPRSPTEELIAAIWAEVLKVQRVGVHDNFFELGGHSLLATRVVSRIRESANVDLPLRLMFEAPTVADLASRIDQMGRSEQLPPMLRRVPRNSPLPLSFAQERLWFLDQLEPNHAYYNSPFAVKMKGVLRLEALELALNEIVRRHDVLRTTFAVENFHPVQVIAPELRVQVPIVDLSGLPAEEQEEAAGRMAIEAAQRTFNLEKGPVFRANLLRLGGRDHILLLNFHHIAIDGWSLWQFVQELAVLYEALTDGGHSPLPDLPVQYADYAVWHRNWMQGDVLAKLLAYWKKQLAGAPATLELPADRVRPQLLSYNGAVVRMSYPARLADHLNALSRSENATLFMTLLAAFQTLLFRYSGQEDIVVGSSIANRTHLGVENLIGFFVNALVMRTDLSGDPSFRQLLNRVRATALDAYAHQDLPFEKLVEALQPDRDLGQTPLFQVCFVLQNAPRTTFRLPDLELSAMDVHNGTTKFDLSLFVVEKPEGLICTAEYSTDLFDAASIHRLLGHFQVLLESIIKNPEQRITALPLLTAAEERVLLSEWNDASIEFPRQTCIQELFELQAERTPGSIAVVFEDRQLTYSELNQRANQLAHRLRALGVGPETLVGICVDPSLEMLICILGVLKAGGGYLPMDPAYPADRLAFILEDAQLPVLLTQTALIAGLPPHHATTLCVDRDWTSIASEPATNPSHSSQSENVAYVIYTSGSTGTPKGCIVTHANVARLFRATDHWFGFGPDDTWTLFHSIAFDFSVWEIWGALLYGGKLVVVPRSTARSPEQFHDLLIQHRVTVLNQTPSAFRQLIVAGEQSGRADRLALRYVIFGGEALEFRTLLPWIKRHGDAPELINMYGITETTVHVTYFKVDVSAIDDNTVSLIGKPIPDLQVYVLDNQRCPVPVGVIGEMYVGGHGVARGYLNRPQLTAERFVQDPFQGDPAARLYKTGDLARFLPDGNLQYLGRMDHQLKIRGFRIEPGEIEARLNSHPGVRESAVIAREDQPGEKRLVAYLIPDPDYSGAESCEPEDALGMEQVTRWTEAFDETYRRGGDAAEAAFNITGWDSSYTGKPIDPLEMRTWVETTVARIRSLGVQRVWEIGCGTGLLLFRLAPHSEQYYGTDISQTALSFVQQQLRRPDLNLPYLNLERRAAHDFDTARHAGQFTTVVLNSVVQYFPSLDYFMKVLDGAVEAVAPGGTIFIGDVRSFPLLEAFHTSVQLYKAPDSMTCFQLRQRAQASMRQEGELLIDPEFFFALRRRHPAIGDIEIQLKRGRAHNELTLFRYDVTLHIGNPSAPPEDCAWLDWKKEGLTLAGLREVLQQTSPEILALTNVPNARLSTDCVALRMLSADAGFLKVGELRKAMHGSSGTAVEPEDLWNIEEELPYRIAIRPSGPASAGCCDVVFQRTAAGGTKKNAALPHSSSGEADAVRPWRTYANNPLRQREAGKLIPEVRAWLDQKLPDYMCPSAYVVLDSLPLTANGKVNRRALPAPDEIRPEGQSEYVAPKGPVEELVAAIFADVLRIDRAGAGDDFFELGGHSLSATQVVSRVRRAFQIELPVRALFESSTVAGLSIVVDQIQRGSRGLVPPPIVPVPRNRSLPLSIAQQRLWILDQVEPNNPLYNVPRAIRLLGTLHVNALAKALSGIVERHEVLRTTYCAELDELIQVIAPELQMDLPIVDLSSFAAVERDKESRRILQEQCGQPFNLAKDPLLRSLLLKLDVQEHILFLNTHHIANDGWSNGVFMRDLAALYGAALEGKPALLPELVIQYADYAVWQRNWLQGEVLARQLEYWKTRLRGAPPVLSLPTDRPRPAEQTFRGGSHIALIPAGLMHSVRALSRQHETTTFMTLLAAFYSLILYYSKQTDIVLGTDVAGRNDLRTEPLIGFFVNLLVLRTDLSGDPTVTELLALVRDTALGAYSHQDAPFDKIVEELRPERSLSHTPLVQTLFVQMSRTHAHVQMPGLEMSPVPLDLPSKFDLAVFAGESGRQTSAMWVYNSDLFDATTIERMAFLYQIALETMTAHADMKLSELLRLLAETDQRQRATENKQFQQISLEKLKKIRRKAASRT